MDEDKLLGEIDRLRTVMGRVKGSVDTLLTQVEDTDEYEEICLGCLHDNLTQVADILAAEAPTEVVS